MFVYGTLRSEFGNPHARGLRDNAECLGKATINGSLYLLGEYPGFRPDPDAVITGDAVVVGELYRLRTPDSTLAALDAYEADEFERIATKISHQGIQYDAWIYQLRDVPLNAPRIASGDFCAL
jgi:gamma-glutamylcyclotransferase (GGCT)/AIG2-like uncharacterized protein YtfP